MGELEPYYIPSLGYKPSVLYTFELIAYTSLGWLGRYRPLVLSSRVICSTIELRANVASLERFELPLNEPISSVLPLHQREINRF